MSQFERTAEILEDAGLALRNRWESASELWLDSSRDEFERTWMEIDEAMKVTVEEFRSFAAIADRARSRLD